MEKNRNDIPDKFVILSYVGLPTDIGPFEIGWLKKK